MIRKANKLPGNNFISGGREKLNNFTHWPSNKGEKISLDYGKEYGTDRIEITKGLISPGEKVIVIDDLLATGGSALAACQLISLFFN